MKSISKIIIAFLVLVCFINTHASAQMSESKAKAWVNKGEWRSGFKLKLYAGLDNVEFTKQYQANKKYWDEAFAFITNTKLDTLSIGKHIIDGDNVFATVADGPTKDLDKTGWEAHHKYIDLHLVISGREKIGVMNPAMAKVTNPYDDTKDVENYDVNSIKGEYYIEDPSTLYIMFPQNAHRPGIHVDGYDKVKKLVIKVRVAK
ncbi:YhcH/YjgK/YiaL family protein [Mucilaginibacter sp. dw_454]|uniref:YhcH/YjgK/YiaL family protein n=1 Tax=Mucilaginibacter sp. dw_454 TaxID=2720079 RepID=UPI001BD5E702|nr:YhcH/YjgK/YiaL family protein [Mucilaginibacter sp. dw_454]